MKKLILLTIILLSPLFAQANTCEDDERLKDKRSLVKAVRSGESISPKITITFETFFNLHPKMRGIIGGGEGDPNFNVVNHNCKTMDFANASTSLKHQMSFKEIKENLAKLQKQGDQSLLEFFVDNVYAAPMSALDIIDLVSYGRESILNRNTTCTLQNRDRLKIGFAGFASNSNKIALRGYKVNDCENADSTVLAPNQIDLYAGFGGKFLGDAVEIESGYLRVITTHSAYGTSARHHYLQAKSTNPKTGKVNSVWLEKTVTSQEFLVSENQHVLNIVAPYMGAEINVPTFTYDYMGDKYRENIASQSFKKYKGEAKRRHLAITSGDVQPINTTKQCQDDDRLQNIHDLMTIAQTQGKISPLVKMDYHTYLNMDQDVRSMIAGGDDALNLDLFDDNCNPIMLIDGAPIDNIEMSFKNIYESILGFEEKGDLESIATLYKTVKAKPESIEKIMDWVLNVNPDIFETSTICYMQEFGAIKVGSAKYGNNVPIDNICDGVSLANQPSKIDLFAAFGGRVVENDVKLTLFSAGMVKHNASPPFPNRYGNSLKHSQSFILQGSYTDKLGFSKPIMRDAWFTNGRSMPSRLVVKYKNQIFGGNYALKDNLMALRVRATELNVDLKIDGWVRGDYTRQSTEDHDTKVAEYEKQLQANLESKTKAEEDAESDQVEIEGGDLEAEELE